jgi:WD40 repeat protein
LRRYFAGTEDGHIHRCSCSYNEQYLDTFSGHSGPVYRIKCSPYHSDAFLSCSADWTVKLWSAKESRMVLDFHSKGLSDVVNDIAWSPDSGTVFASVTGDGRVDVWDLDYSEIEPKIFHRPSQPEAVLGVTPLTTCLFSDNAPVLATGDANGKVDIFKLEGMDVKGTPAEQTRRLEKAMEPKEHA